MIDLAPIKVLCAKKHLEWAQLRPILNTGICDGCAEQKILQWEYIPTEAWLCHQCYAEGYSEEMQMVSALEALMLEAEQLRSEAILLRAYINYWMDQVIV